MYTIRGGAFRLTFGPGLTLSAAFGESTKLTDMAGREEDLNKWLRGLKREGGTRDGLPISAGTSNCGVVIGFLKSTNTTNDHEIIRRQRIFAISDEHYVQARRLLEPRLEHVRPSDDVHGRARLRKGALLCAPNDQIRNQFADVHAALPSLNLTSRKMV